MSTSFIYHAWGMSDYEYVGQKFYGGAINIHARPKWRIIKCPLCGNRLIIRKGVCARKLRTVPIGQKPVWLLVDIPRVYCPKCDCVRQINPVMSKPRKSYNRAFERYVIALSKVMTLKDIATFLRLWWDLVKDTVKSSLAKCFSKLFSKRRSLHSH